MSASKTARAKSAETTQLLRDVIKQGKMAEIADLTGISKDVFQGIVLGTRSPSGNQRNKIKEAVAALQLGCPPR